MRDANSIALETLSHGIYYRLGISIVFAIRSVDLFVRLNVMREKTKRGEAD